MRRSIVSNSAKAFLNFTLTSSEEENGEARSSISTVIRGDEKRSTRGSAAYRLSCLIGARASALADELEPGEDTVLLSGEELMSLLKSHGMSLELRVRKPGDKAEEPADDSWDF